MIGLRLAILRQATLAISALISMAIFLPSPSHADTLPGQGKTIRLAKPSWDTDWFSTQIYAEAFKALGYKIAGPTTLDVPTFFQSAGQGDIDLWVSGWFPLHQPYLDQFANDLTVVGTVAANGALQGFLVDKKTADTYHITNLADFKKPEIAALFDNHGDGKADLVACPPGWGCEKDIDERLEAFGLQDSVRPLKAAYAASMADIMGRFSEGKPIFFYTWTPNWTIGALKPGRDVVWIETPIFPNRENETPKIASVEGCVTDPCRLGWVAGDIRAVANNDFLRDNPPIRKLLEAASLPISDIHAQNARMNAGESTEADISRHAREWIAKHKDTFDNWIAAAKKEK